MKRLLILRHAKAVAKDAAEDFDRPLSGTGRSQMKLMAAELGRLGPPPDLALVSPAARTRETWALAGLPAGETRFEPSIYEASPDTLLALVQGCGDEAGSAILVGHNPGLELLAASLASGRSGKELARGMPTAALAVLDFAADRWREVAPRAGRLQSFSSPASLGGDGS